MPTTAVRISNRIDFNEQVIYPPVIIDDGYELRRWPYYLALPGMWVLAIWVMIKKWLFHFFGREPETNTLWFDAAPICRSIKKNAARWGALNIIYNHKFGTCGRITDFWLGMINAQAVRNRKKLVVSLLVKHLRHLSMQEHELILLSIASGSAQSVLEAIAILKRQGILVKAILFDMDASALKNSVRLAIEYDVADQIVCIRDKVRNLKIALQSFPRPHMIELVGLLDYFQDERAINLISVAKKLLRPGGVLLAGHIANNPEQLFLSQVINWRMLYRTAKNLGDLCKAGGFKNVHTLSEPHHIHNIAVCT